MNVISLVVFCLIFQLNDLKKIKDDNTQFYKNLVDMFNRLLEFLFQFCEMNLRNQELLVPNIK